MRYRCTTKAQVSVRHKKSTKFASNLGTGPDLAFNAGLTVGGTIRKNNGGFDQDECKSSVGSPWSATALYNRLADLQGSEFTQHIPRHIKKHPGRG